MTANATDVDQRATTTTQLYRLINEPVSVELNKNTDYFWTAGFRYYRPGTNTSTGTSTQSGDSTQLSFNFVEVLDDGATRLIGAAAALITTVMLF